MYSLRRRLPHGTSSIRVWTTSTLRNLSRIASASSASALAPRASSTLTGSGGSCFTPGACGLTRIWPLTCGAKALTTSRTAEGKTLTPRTMSMSSVRPMQRTRGPVRPHAHVARPELDVVARAEAQQRRGAVAKVCQHELAVGAVVERDGGARLRLDQLGVDEAARAEVHAVLLLALAPERHADVADPHRLGHLRAPALLELGAERGSPPPGSPATSTRRRSSPRDRRPARRPTRRGTRRTTGVSTATSGLSRSTASSRRSVLPVPNGMWQRPMRSKAASAAPATNGPALYVETVRWPAVTPEAA